VLATDLSLDYGFAKALLLRWAADPVNTVLLTQRGHGATVARELMRGVSAGIASSSVVGAGSSSSSGGVEGASALQHVVVEVSTLRTY
jgi:Beta-Casp domain